MKFQNLSRALLLLSGALGMTLGLTSCSNDRTVGYVYVLGTTVSGTTSGSIGALREDNNNGNLTNVVGGAVSSGGDNPVRAVVTTGNRFLYVLNAGTAKANINSSTLQSALYTGSNISLFSIGGYGQLSQQLQYASQGYGTKRIAVNSAGTFLYVLDYYSPVGVANGGNATPSSQTTPSASYPCLGADNLYYPTGDISVYSIDGPTGRLQVQTNQQQTGLTYFPVGCFPTDFHLTAGYLYTMDAGAPAVTNGAATVHANDLQTVYVQAINSTNGQLTPTQTNVLQVTTNNSSTISAINGNNSAYVYLLDTQHNLIYDYAVGANGALTTVSGSPFSNKTQAVGPIQSTVDSTGKYVYFANGGIAAGNSNPNNAAADVTGYNINATTGDLNVPVQNGGFTLGSVASPVCIFEDPTNQFIYVAGAADNSITGRIIDPNTGTLKDLNKAVAFPTVGTPSWCLGISSAL